MGFIRSLAIAVMMLEMEDTVTGGLGVSLQVTMGNETHVCEHGEQGER